MKKFTLSSIICILILSFTSCGDKVLSKITLNKDLEYCVDVLTWEKENDFFEPVKGTYKLIEKDGQLQITIKFVKIEECKHHDYTVDEFVLQAVDGNDHLIQINGEDVEFLAENKTEVVNDLFTAKVGDKIDVVFTLPPVDKESKETIISNFKACFFELSLD